MEIHPEKSSSSFRPRHTISLSRWDVFRDWVRETKGGFLILLGGMSFFICLVVLACLHNVPLDALSHSGVARIDDKRMTPAKSGSGYWLLFRIQNQPVLLQIQALDLAKWKATRLGDYVPVTFRANKQGDIVIDDWQPSSPSTK